jgi:hypothetical protein
VKTKKPSKAKLLEQRVAQLEAALTPDMQRKIADSHNIVGDVMAFNDRLIEIQNTVKPQVDLQEMHDQCVKMVRRINKTHGDLFKHRAEQLVDNERSNKQFKVFADSHHSAVEKTNSNFATVLKDINSLKANPWLRIGSALGNSWPYIVAMLAGIAIYKVVFHD